MKHRRKLLILVLTVLILLITLFAFLFEHYAMPVAYQLAKEDCITRVNQTLTSALNETIAAKSITQKDLYTPYFDQSNRLTYLEVNSLAVNALCAETASKLSEDLNSMSSNAIKLPLGAITDIHLFSHTGPHIPIYLTPSGSAVADYETSLENAGINQVNFKVWLVAEIEMGIVNPFLDKRIKITRKIMLVNTLFSGEVPENFYGIRN